MGVNFQRPSRGNSPAAEGIAGDAQLQHAIQRDVRAGHERAVLALHLALLQAAEPKAYHRRIAKAMLDDAALSHAGQVFVRGNADVVLLCDSGAAAGVRDTLNRVFRTEAPTTDQLTTLWTLPHDAIALEAYLSHTTTPATSPGEPSTSPQAVQAIQLSIDSVPARALMRRQLAIEVVPGGMRPLFRELAFSIAVIDARAASASNGATRGPPGSIMTDPYLFRHLAGQLDLRMLQWLTKGFGTLSRHAPQPSVHINLTVRTILSPAFSHFAEAANLASFKVGVEIALIDACADPLAFGAARMVLRAHGYTVALDGLGHEALVLTRPEAFEPDLIKLDWSPHMTRLGRRESRALAEAMSRIGLKRLLLHRVETAAAFGWGLSQGIVRFQGWHIDALQAAGRLAVCAHATGCTARQCIERGAAADDAGRAGCRSHAQLDAAEISAASLAGLARA